MPPTTGQNPILKYTKSPIPKGVSGGGKNEKGIKQDSLTKKQLLLSEKVKSFTDDQMSEISFSGITHIIAKMDEDSLSPSWTPSDVFDSRSGCRIISPAYRGFLIELETKNLKLLEKNLLNPKKTNDKVDISRIATISLFDNEQTLRGETASTVWDSLPKPKEFKPFNIWIKPFKNIEARLSVSKKLEAFFSGISYTLGDPAFNNIFSDKATENSKEELKSILTDYNSTGAISFSVNIKTKDDFDKIISSGAIYRIEPATPITTTSKPGLGTEPNPTSIHPTAPTVVIIDGGVNARSYIHLQKITLPPLVPDYDADLNHGNKVASLVCQAHAWNNNRPLPELDCTYISAQAICKDMAPTAPNHRQLLTYLDEVAQRTAGYSRVWNLSFNQMMSNNAKDEISYLGHKISKLARKYEILPIISAGNTKHNTSNSKICPPADCEAALTISGRHYDENEMKLGSGCKYSLKGPAPAGMKKPDLSWFSELRMIGGSTDIGTSFSAPLISSMAAHSFANIKDATPDLVRALLINKSELASHSETIGWGTPWAERELPWFCAPGTVTISWTSKLQPGFNYYWTDIPIPAELIIDDKFVGTVALTAVLTPLVSESVGENYFASRLQTSLQTHSASGTIISLAGTMREDKEKEATARKELSKWSPVRHHVKTHKGTGISTKMMRLNARIFTRDLYQFDISHHSELEPQEVAFVLSFKSSTNNPSLYNTTVKNMSNNIESAVLHQDIQVSN